MSEAYIDIVKRRKLNMDNEKREQLRQTLEQNFGVNGVARWSRYFPVNVIISEGIEYLIDNSDAKGFIDIVASYQSQLYFKGVYHQHWTIRRGDTHWQIYMERFDQDEGPKLMQRVYLGDMDFPFDEFTVVVGYMSDRQCGICLLNEED